MTASRGREHGGDLGAAIARWGGAPEAWLDLSTGINPVPYPVGDPPADAWTRLPGREGHDRLIAAARAFWQIPDAAAIIPAPGASALIARIPYLWPGGGLAHVPGPTYNEHRGALEASGAWTVSGAPEPPAGASLHIHTHPNNPDGRLLAAVPSGPPPLTIVDESFCDTMPDQSHVAATARPGTLVLKSFGKFWGLAGLRLGFAIVHQGTPVPRRADAGPPSVAAALDEQLGPWPVSGPALAIGARALRDVRWAEDMRARLGRFAQRLDAIMTARGAEVAGGTTLFRLYRVDDANAWQNRLARRHVWSRTFGYAPRWLRLGLPPPDRWAQLEEAL